MRFDITRYENNSFYRDDTVITMGTIISVDDSITEQCRIIQDKSGLWLCQDRFYNEDRNYTTGWQTIKMYKTEEEAKRYFTEMPDWVKEF